MFQSQKNVFWQAFLFTLLIFGIGIVLGIILENWRTGTVDELYQNSELDLIDIKLQTEIYSTTNFDCNQAVIENIKFADRIYNEAKLLERYQNANELTSNLELRHQKYDILRANLLLNSIKIREKCNSTYYEVVYIYRNKDTPLEIKAKQNTFSKLLMEMKTRLGNKVLLIPMAGDSDVSSINLLKGIYGVSDSDLPIIVINGKTNITNLETIDELMKNFK